MSETTSLNADVHEIKGDVKQLLKCYQEIQGSLGVFDVRLKHGEGEFGELKVRLDKVETKVESSFVTLDACKERHGGNRWLIGTVIACASLVIACIALFVPAKASGLAITEVPPMELIELVKANWSAWLSIAGGILLLVGALAKMVEGFSTRYAAASEKFKGAIVTLASGLVGLAVAFVPGANMPWYVGLVVGILAGAGVIGTNAGYAAGQRHMVRRRGMKAARALVEANRAMRRHQGGFGTFYAMLVLLVISLAFSGIVSCTAAQQQIQQGIWAQGGLGMSKCLLECGAPAVTTHIDYNEVSIDTTGMTDDLLSCLMSCTTKIGIPTIIASVISAVSGRDMQCDGHLERRLVVTKRLGE
jgi:hypothetical protein